MPASVAGPPVPNYMLLRTGRRHGRNRTRKARARPTMPHLNELNTCARDDFVAAVGDIFEHAPWVAEAAFAARPFATVAALHEAMLRAVRQAPNERQLGFIRGHPELGSKVARAGGLTEASRAEQGSLGLDRLSNEEFARFERLNKAYRDKFAF